MAFTTFDEYQGSPIYSFQTGSQNAVRKGKIPWSDVDAILTELFPVAGQSTLAFPGRPQLKASRIRIEPLAKSSDKTTTSSGDTNLSTLNEYNFAEVTIDYEADANTEGGSGDPSDPNDPNDPNDPVELLSHRWSIGGEFLTVPSTGWVWNFDGADVDRELSLGIMVPTIEHQITWPRVQNPPFTAIRNCVGRINSVPITFSTGTVIEETLLFLGADMQREILSSGALAWEMSYRFSERKVDAGDFGLTSDANSGGWNHFYRSDDQFATDNPKVGFYRVKGKLTYTGDGTYSGSNKNPYELKDFSALFVEEN
jgi:hypothetical protein